MSQTKPTKIECTRYAEAYILYNDKSKAFLSTFPKTKAKPESINAMACEFHKILKVSLMIDELRESLDEDEKHKAKNRIKRKQEILYKVAEYGIIEEGAQNEDDFIKKQANPSASVSAVKELNVMDGDQASQKQDVTHHGAVELTRYIVECEPDDDDE